MALKAKKPELLEKRLKMFVYGEAGIGKTTAAIQFPNAYIIDTERGTDFYAKSINKAGSVVLQTLNPDEIKEEVMQLLTTEHSYRTLILDPVTQIYNATQEKWTRIFEKHAKTQAEKEVQDFGVRYWGKVKGDFKGLQRMLTRLDMNIIVTAHQKDVYGQNFSKLGVTFDSMKGDDYFFDLIFRIVKRGSDRIAITEKERAEVGEGKFPPEFVWSYENFCKYYGAEVIERKAVPVVMATPEQVEKIESLLATVKIEDGLVEKWLAKADVNEFREMTGETIGKCIDYLEDRLKGARKERTK
jgi:GTPase SAR1 family protein